MFGRARSSAATKRETEEQDPRRSDVAQELRAAWRMAYVIVGDTDLATQALAKAYHGRPVAAPASEISLDLLANTLRISLTRASSEMPPGQDKESAVISAMWQLPAEQRAALWLAEVGALPLSGLASVLGLPIANAGHVAARAVEWLDVALDQDSGPLCPNEVRLADFVADRLADEEADEFEGHLAGCPTCRTKVRSYEELADLPDVLDAAIPAPPSWLNVEALEAVESPALRQLRKGPPTLVLPPGRRTPAVRALAVCCVALIAVGLIGIKVIKSEKSNSDPPAATDPPGAPARLSNTGGSGASLVTTTVPPTTATTVVVTTTSLPVLTFPTLPPATSRRKK